MGVLAQNLLLCNTFPLKKKTRSAARIETAGDSEELLARVVDPTSSSYFLPVAGKGHIPCLENVTEHPTPGAILEVGIS